jgi:hypothetical protein
MNDTEWIKLIRKYLNSDVEKAVGEIVGFSNYAESYDIAEKFLLELTQSKEPNIKGISILGLGHLARVHKLSSEKAVSIVKLALTDDDKFVSGHADSAADDISFFTEFKVNE